jgi:hypothetical protein
LEQDDECPGADAADADHLAGHVHHLEALRQPPPVVLQGGPVGAELLADQAADLGAFSCRAFFAPFSSPAVAATVLRIEALRSSSFRWAYQMSIVRICANEAMASR